MNNELILEVLRVIFGHESYVTLYGNAISIKKLKEFVNEDCDYLVRINWRILERAINQSETSKEKVTSQEIKHYKEAGAILRSMRKEEK